MLGEHEETDWYREGCIFATNTSSLSVTEIASSCSDARQKRWVLSLSSAHIRAIADVLTDSLDFISSIVSCSLLDPPTQ